MVAIRKERAADVKAREALLDAAYGPARFLKTSARLREGRLPADDLSFVAVEQGQVIGTLRLWPISAGPGRPALMLGPLAVAVASRARGIGAALVARSLRDARRRGHRAVLLVGDAPYYGRFGFSPEKTGWLRLPGPYESHRLLALELMPGALDDARGLISATGTPEAQPDLNHLVAAIKGGESNPMRHVA